MNVPSNRAAGAGLVSFVRGSGARYIHARGRWRSSASEDSIRSDQLASPQPPSAPAGPSEEPSTAIQPSAGTERASLVCLYANGRRRVPSKNVHHTEPRGGWPGCLWTVQRIHSPSGSSGATARR